MTTEERITCQQCKAAPAVQVIVADLVGGGRIVHLVCASCGEQSVDPTLARHSDFIWRFALTPIPEGNPEL